MWSTCAGAAALADLASQATALRMIMTTRAKLTDWQDAISQQSPQLQQRQQQLTLVGQRPALLVALLPVMAPPAAVTMGNVSMAMLLLDCLLQLGPGLSVPSGASRAAAAAAAVAARGLVEQQVRQLPRQDPLLLLALSC